jgi:hypothetical protein
MGQAAIDLPDPLNAPPPAAESSANTDDLLAQMAGEEIDRLLAEQEGERPAQPAALRPDAPPSPPSPPIPAGSSDEAKTSDAAALDGFLGGIAPASDAGPDPVATLAAQAQAQGPSDAKSTAELLDEELAADEGRAALNSSKFTANAGAETPPRSSSVPLPLRVLAWASAPLDACPDHVREAIGKIAIVTTVNAIAVLVYVLFFRTHHG